MWTIFKVFIEFVTLLLLFYVLVFWPRGIWDLSSPTRDRTHTPCIGRQSLNQWTAREVSRYPHTAPGIKMGEQLVEFGGQHLCFLSCFGPELLLLLKADGNMGWV